MGFRFRQGEIPAGQGVVVTGATAQAKIKNVYPDGSAAFAEVAGTYVSTGGTPTNIVLGPGVASTGTDLTTTNLQTALSGVSFVFDAGAFGSSTFSGSDFASPHLEWTRGHAMSVWTFCKQIGSDAHLRAWLRVRLFAGGVVEYLPWIENGFVLVAGPTNKSATYTLTVGGSVRFTGAIDLKHHTRTPLINGAALGYWIGATDPGVSIKHDAAYMQATEAVPTYRVAVGTSDAIVTALPSTFAPLQAGSLVYSNDSMPDPGFQAPIGLLPQHDVLHLVADTFNTYGATIRTGYSAGRYPIHYRDENTLRPIIPANHVGTTIPNGRGILGAGTSEGSVYPGGTNTPSVTGGNAPSWDTAHCPSVGFMAYLLTADPFHLETAQFAAAINYLARANTAQQRGTGGQGFVHVDPNSVGVRDSAWAWRTLTQAVTITPDADTTWRNAWKTVAQTNIDDYHAQYVSQSNNPLGFTQSGTMAYDGSLGTTAPWMHDFQSAAWGYSSCMGLPLDPGYQTKLDAVHAFMAKSCVSRLGVAGSGWAWQNPAVYNGKVSASTNPNWSAGTGPWYTAAEAYAATYAAPPGWLASTAGNVIGDENLPGSYPACVRSFFGNLQPAISYAVRKGVAGANAAQNRLLGADNWPNLLAAMPQYPGWAIKPASGEQPAWRRNRTAYEFFEISGTSGADGASIDSWANLVTASSKIYFAADGGHTNSSDNRVSGLDTAADAPSWMSPRPSAPSSVGNIISLSDGVGHYLDGKPGSRHGYHHGMFIPGVGANGAGRVFLVGQRGRYVDGGDNRFVDAFDPSTGLWDAANTWSSVPVGGGYGCVVDRLNQHIWTTSNHRFNPVTGSWDVPTITGPGFTHRWPVAYDTRRHQFFALQWGDGQGFSSGATAAKLDIATLVSASITLNSVGGALAQFTTDAPEYCGMDYDPINDEYLFYEGYSNTKRVYCVKPTSGSTWDISIKSIGVGSITPAAAFGVKGNNYVGTNGRFKFMPEHQAFILIPRGSSNIVILPVV